MRLLFLGDVMGRAGRAAIAERLPKLREAWKLDFVVVNGENASNGMGLTAEHAKGILEAGADVVTLGDHAFDQKDMLQFIETEPRVIRPVNFAKGAKSDAWLSPSTRIFKPANPASGPKSLTRLPSRNSRRSLGDLLMPSKRVSRL